MSEKVYWPTSKPRKKRKGSRVSCRHCAQRRFRLNGSAGLGERAGAGVNPVTGNLASMDSMTAVSDHTGILAAAHTSGSGMSHGGDGGPTGRNILLTVIVDASVHGQAMSLIEEAGGMI